MGLKGIVLHWDAGDDDFDGPEGDHYHFMFDADGGEHRGQFTVADNFNTRDKRYAPHVRGANTGRAGLAALGMRGANLERRLLGPDPVSVAACDAMCERAAKLCREYGLPVTRKSVLTHAEVENELGIRQRAKWDFRWLPYPGFGTDGWASARACGDFLRERVRAHLAGDAAPEAEPVEWSAERKRISYLQKLTERSGHDIGPHGPDGLMGSDTSEAIERFQRALGLPVTGQFDRATVAALREAHEEVGAREAAEHEVGETLREAATGVTVEVRAPDPAPIPPAPAPAPAPEPPANPSRPVAADALTAGGAILRIEAICARYRAEQEKSL